MKIRNTYMTIAALAAYILSSCTAEIENPNGFEKIEDGTILAEIPAYHRADQGTKANISDDLSVFTWSDGDQIGVEYSDGITDAFTRYTILKGGSSIGSFRNDAFRLRQDSEYYVTYPSADYDYPATLFMNFRGQFQSANNSAAHIGPRNYMTAIVRTDANHGAKFKFQNQAAVLQITFALPKDTEIKSLEIESLRKELILESFIQTKSNQYIPLETSSSLEMFFGTEIHGPGIKVKAGEPFVANMLFSRIDLYGSELVFTVRDVEGNVVKTFHDSGKRIDAGNAYSFGTTDVVIEPDPDAEYVDLGLPSGTLWAKCNLGATAPEEYGDYYAWGETKPMTNMNVFDYTYTGNDVVIPLSADAAHVQLGGNWRIPSEAELRELYENCSYHKACVNDVYGLKFVSDINGESIFLPFAGKLYPSVEGLGTEGYYRSSFRFTDYSSWYLAIGMTTYSFRAALWAHSGGRSGMSIRPVISKDFPSMYIKDNAANFGSVRIGTTETRFITIKNTGRAPLNISSIKMSKGNAFTVGMSGCAINPGMIETIPIHFKPSSETRVTDTLRIISNSLNIPEYVLVVSGSGNSQKYTAGEAVDLGLSVKWSSVNLGATSPEKLGRTFAWGEVTACTDTEVAYKWFNGYPTDYGGVIKYNCFDNNGNVDNKVILDPEDDAATFNLGSQWRMPTKAEFKELLNNCTWTLTGYLGVKGYEITGSNGNSIFLPLNDNGYYWSSSLSDSNMESAFMLSISGTSKTVSSVNRAVLCCIRPVEN